MESTPVLNFGQEDISFPLPEVILQKNSQSAMTVLQGLRNITNVIYDS